MDKKELTLEETFELLEGKLEALEAELGLTPPTGQVLRSYCYSSSNLE